MRNPNLILRGTLPPARLNASIPPKPTSLGGPSLVRWGFLFYRGLGVGKNVVFYLGPAVGLSARQLTITRMPDASNASYSATVDSDVGANTSTTQALADNIIYQAKLVDTKSTGEVSSTKIINFHTGSLQFPGPFSGEDPNFYIYAMEDLSSSSSSSSSQSSSSSSSVTSSSSSSSVTSSSSSSSG